MNVRSPLASARRSLPLLLLLVAAFLALINAFLLVEGRATYNPSVSSRQADARAYRGKVSLAHITFASGNRQSSDQVFWEDIVSKIILSQPDHFTPVPSTISSGGGERDEQAAEVRKHSDMLLWAGNAVYTDISDAGVELVQPRTPAEIEKQYKLLSQNTYYQSFLTRFIRAGNVVGVWDEHDMGLRHGAEKNYSQAGQVRDIYIKHILNDRQDIKEQLSQRAGGGLYHFTTVPAPSGSALSDVYRNAVCVVALDVVSFRDPYPDFTDALLTPFPPGASGYGQARKVKELPQADLLGEAQWAWLEDIIKRYVAPRHPQHSQDIDERTGSEKEECALTVFASAWQILLNDNKPFSGWDLFPASRTRLLALLKNHEVSRFVFLTGHAELGEIGGIIANTNADVARKQKSSVMGLYAQNFPLTPLTKYSRKLLPFASAVGENPDAGAAGERREHSDEHNRAGEEMAFTPGEADRAAHGLVEATSSGLTHALSNAPFVGRFASWLVDGDTTSDTLAYVPDDLLRSDRAKTLEESAMSSFRFMSRYLVVGRKAKPRRNIGTLQLLSTQAAAKAVLSSASRDAPGEKRRKDVGEKDDPRLAGYGNGPAAVKAFVDDNVRVLVAVHAIDDGSTLITYEATLAQLPDYRRRRRTDAATGAGVAPSGHAQKGTAHFIDYREIPPFSIFNIPGEFPNIKRSILSRNCPEVPCIHGKFFMIGKTLFTLAIAFVVLMVLAALIIAVLLCMERRRELAERKLKAD